MTDVKVCGLTRVEDVALACELGARYLGFNFSAASPRLLTLDAARRLADAASPGVARVGVFVDESPEEMREAAEAARLDFVQLHRRLRSEDVDAAPRPIFAVARIGNGSPLPGAGGPLALCRAILFDTADAGMPGGTGVTFDWGLVAGTRWPVPVFLAGGLAPDNVGAAIERVRAAAVDVASGVESAPGIKDSEKMARFFRAVEEVDARLA
ncbi:MAG: phosphoribosylanthranilate isomerase [Acidobacteriota bacterium]